ncbi:MAG: hypothetical protein NTW29_13505 [Bacteroidetes bacterium]|nr:hypothetical protein [Bacteroidota bacterium]
MQRANIEPSFSLQPTPTVETSESSADIVKTIHVFVPLCDNKYQGIVPVPAKTGNGQDPGNNLYWGWSYGIRTYFKKSREWIFIRSVKVNDTIPERLLFRHRDRSFFLIADAYDGRYIKSCTVDFLKGLGGVMKDTMMAEGRIAGLYGNASALAYNGHNGLMDVDVPVSTVSADGIERDCFILACISKPYFSGLIQKTKARPLLWTSGLMGPEAYTLHDALTGYINSENGESIRMRAAKAYSGYAKCSVQAAKKLLLTGF